MSWHYSQALVEEFSALTCLDGDQCARLKSNRTAERSCFEGKKKKFYRRFLSGMTCEHLMANLGVALWMSSLEDSPVRTYPLPESAQESKGNARDCGQSSQESLAKFDPVSRSWRTAQLSLFGGSVEFSETWPKWGSTRNGECWAQPTHVGIAERRRSITIALESGSSQKIVTPHGMSNGQGQGGGEFDKAARKMPTPTVQDSANNGGPSQSERNTPPLNALVGGKLNPMWVEWLMGWPLGWTDLKPLETDRLQQWLSSHGKSLEVTNG